MPDLGVFDGVPVDGPLVAYRSRKPSAYQILLTCLQR
jgi:hypothetical protein